MLLAARGRETGSAPSRLVFDEGHHLFDAADSTFAVALTGQETIELRRWLLGPESRARGRRRGLAARRMDVASYEEQGAAASEAIITAAAQLPPQAWPARPAEGCQRGEPRVGEECGRTGRARMSTA